MRGYRMISMLLILALAMAAQTRSAAPPSRFETEACTMECCGYGTWHARARAIAFVKRDTASAIAFAVQPNDSVVAVSGIVVMQQPGVSTANSSRKLQLDSYPKPGASRVITLAPGDTVYTLFESAEATDAIIWYRGSIYQTIPLYNGFTQLSPLRDRWWASVRNKRGQVGWVSEPQGDFDGPGECRG